MSVNRLLFSGALWSWVTKFGNQGVSFIVFLIVARIIGPEQYGLASLCFVVFALGSIILNGLGDGIIALQEKGQAALSSLFWFIMSAAVSMSLLCFFLAEPVAKALSMPGLSGLLMWFSPVFVCFAVGVIPNKLIYADMNFKLFAIRGLVGSITSAVVGVVMAYKGFGAYAIIGQQLTLYLVMSLIVWWVTSWRPALIISRHQLARLIPPGFRAMSTESLDFVDQQLPRVLVGIVLGPVALGYFAFVARIRYAIQDILINPPLIVLYPAIAKMKDDIEQQRNIAGHVLRAVCSIVFPMLALAIVLAPQYTPILFGDKWIGAIPVLQIFILGCVFLPITILVRELFRAHNRLGKYILVQSCVLPATLLLYVIFLPMGLVSLSWALCCLAGMVVTVQLYVLETNLKLGITSPVIKLIKPFAVVLLMVGIIVSFQGITQEMLYPSVYLVLSVILGLLSYSIVSLLMFRQDVLSMIKFFSARKVAG